MNQKKSLPLNSIHFNKQGITPLSVSKIIFSFVYLFFRSSTTLFFSPPKCAFIRNYVNDLEEWVKQKAATFIT